MVLNRNKLIDHNVSQALSFLDGNSATPSDTCSALNCAFIEHRDKHLSVDNLHCPIEPCRIPPEQLVILDLAADRTPKWMARKIHKLMEKVEIPEELKCTATSTKRISGYIFVDEVKKIFSELTKTSGYQLLILYSPRLNRVLGFYMYRIVDGIKELREAKGSLAEKILALRTEHAANRILKNFKISIDNECVIDPDAEKIFEDQGSQLDRRMLYLFMHGRCIKELQQKNVKLAFASCWVEPFDNLAIKAHEAAGWRTLSTDKFFLGMPYTNKVTGISMELKSRMLWLNPLDLFQDQAIKIANRGLILVSEDDTRDDGISLRTLERAFERLGEHGVARMSDLLKEGRRIEPRSKRT